MVKYYLELWFHFVCTVVLLLVPFLFYNLLCFFSVISPLFSKGCWLCVNWTHYALTLLCVCVLCMLPVPSIPDLHQKELCRLRYWHVAMGWGRGNSAGSWLSSFEPESPSWWLWRWSLLSWKHRSLCSLNRRGFNHRSLSGGVFGVLPQVSSADVLQCLN